MAPKRPSALDDPSSSESEEISNTPQPQNPDDSDESDVESSEEERETAKEEEEERETTKEEERETAKEEERETAEEKEEERETAKEEDERETAEEEGETADKPSDDEDDDDETASSDFNVKPAVSKPMIESPKPKKASAPKSAPKQASDLKMGKPKGEQKKPQIVRIWTEEGELAALRAMLEYRSKKGLEPSADMGAFYKFAKKLIPIEVTRNQVIDKIRRLRKKYKNNALTKGDDRVFFKTHDLKCFELSKKIWGGGGAAESGAKSAKRKLEIVADSVEKESNKKVKTNKPLEPVKDDGKEIVVEKGVVGGEDQVGFWDKYPRLKESLEAENNGSFLKDGKKAMEFDLSKMGDAKAKELEDKWKRYQAKEAELKLFKLELVVEQTKVVLGELMKH